MREYIKSVTKEVETAQCKCSRCRTPPPRPARKKPKRETHRADDDTEAQAQDERLEVTSHLDATRDHAEDQALQMNHKRGTDLMREQLDRSIIKSHPNDLVTQVLSKIKSLRGDIEGIADSGITKLAAHVKNEMLVHFNMNFKDDLLLQHPQAKELMKAMYERLSDIPERVELVSQEDEALMASTRDSTATDSHSLPIRIPQDNTTPHASASSTLRKRAAESQHTSAAPKKRGHRAGNT